MWPGRCGQTIEVSSDVRLPETDHDVKVQEGEEAQQEHDSKEAQQEHDSKEAQQEHDSKEAQQEHDSKEAQQELDSQTLQSGLVLEHVWERLRAGRNGWQTLREWLRLCNGYNMSMWAQPYVYIIIMQQNVGWFGEKTREARLMWLGRVLRKDDGYIGRRKLVI